MNKLILLFFCAGLTTGCAHLRTACSQDKSMTALGEDYLNCMRDVKLAPKINACYDEVNKTDKGFHIRIVTVFDVSADGKVKNAKLDPDPSPLHPELAKCMVSAVNDTTFLKHEGVAHVEYPWVLHAATNSVFQF